MPDTDKGERLVLATNEPRITLNDARAIIRDRGMSNLCAPREICLVASIPKLNTGKTDYREILRMIADRVEPEATTQPERA